MVRLLDMTDPTPLYLLVEDRLGEPLAEFVDKRRPDMAWRRIAAEITERTGVAITYETLRSWSTSERAA